MSPSARVLALIAVAVTLSGCAAGSARSEEVLCQPDDAAPFILMAQSVPSATLLPCIRLFPPGWGYGGSEMRNGTARFWLDSDRAGIHSVEVVLAPSCDVAGLEEVTRASGELDVRVYRESISVTPYAADRHFVFVGGCVTYRYRFLDVAQAATLAFEADDALTFLPRAEVVDLVEEGWGLTLCGAEAPPCVGED
ncbi:MAG TPA: hypothetical protein VFK59_07150 [Actinomycetota bacterium]|nr:hypothetical protein [Actinomycetota bacterium]